LAERFTRETGIAATVDADVRGRPKREPELVAFRVVQEALTNVTKHADAEHVAVRLAGGRKLTVEVWDDGQGFDLDAIPPPGADQLGLDSLRDAVEHAGGTLIVESRPGEGTAVRASLPADRSG
jgi:signal transduction histidine kinase